MSWRGRQSFQHNTKESDLWYAVKSSLHFILTVLFLLFLQVPITPANAQYITHLSYVLHSARSLGARYHHASLRLLPFPFFPLCWAHPLCLLLMNVQSLVDLSVVKDLLSSVLVLSRLKLHDLLKDLSSVIGLASDLLRTAIP